MILWLQFIGAVCIIIISGRKLVYHADRFAKQKGWGEMLVGFILLSLATTLPELFTSLGAIVIAKSPNLAMGDIFGSIAFNLFILAILDMVQGKGPIMRQVSTKVITCGGISIILCAIAALGISSGISFTFGGLSPFSIVIAIVWLGGAKLIFKKGAPEKRTGKISSIEPLLKYLLCALFIFGASILLVRTAKEIAIETGMAETFVGALFLGIATSLPEVTTTISAIRKKAYDMAIGNIFGANMFNVALIFLCDASMRRESIFTAVSGNHTFTALLGILMTAAVIVGIIYRSKKSFLRLGWDTIGIAVIYITGICILFKLG